MRFCRFWSVIFAFSSAVALMKLLTAVLSESIFVGWFQAIFSAIEPDTSSTSTMSSGWFVTISPVPALFAPVTFNATLYVPSPLAVTVFSRAGADNVGSSGTPFVPSVERGVGTLAAAFSSAVCDCVVEAFPSSAMAVALTPATPATPPSIATAATTATNRLPLLPAAASTAANHSAILFIALSVSLTIAYARTWRYTYKALCY